MKVWNVVTAKIFIGMLICTQSAFAFPVHFKRESVRIPNTLKDGYNFEGIVALDNCSGSLIQFEHAKPTDKALIMTNGHCLESGFAQPGQFTSHAPSSRTFSLLSTDGQSTVGTLTATEVVYSTMTVTDITLYKVDQTYAEILTSYGVHPLTLSSQHPSLNTAIDVLSGYWQKGYSCQIEFFVNELKEDVWSFQDSLRYSRPGCETIGGTSGSPVIQSGTRTVIAINNTGNESGEKCTENNPCEVDKAGNITFQKGLSYGQETYIIYTCVNAQNELDLTLPGCVLPH